MPLDDLMIRRASFTPDSFNADAMTVEAVVSTFASVTRRDSRGPYTERLDPAALDLSGLNGSPVLDGHRQGSARDVIGVIIAHRMEGGSLVATIRLSSATDAASIITRIQEGTLKGVSIGYRVTRWADSFDPATKARVRTAAAWAISEVSAVPIPADPGATFRSDPMPKDNQDDPRAALIQRVAAAHNLPEEWQARMAAAEDELTDDEIREDGRAAAAEALQARARQTPRIRTVATQDDPATAMQRRADALYARVSGTAPKPEAAPYMGDTLRDHARAAVEATGVSTRGMDADQLFRAAMHTTSDFPNLLTGTGNRTLMAGYQTAQSPIKTTLARQATAPDFRALSTLKLSDVGLLEKVSESGEIKSNTRGEAKESYSLDTYATQFAISRKALINDDLGAFRDWGATAGRMAAETEANLLLTKLLSNPVMGEDGLALFHATHGNLATGAALDVAALDAARRAMRGMKGLDGVTPINATPRFLVVGPELETTAEQVLASIYAATVADVNAFSGKLTLLVEPRITDESFYLFADPAVLPVLEYAYLSSAQGPQMASREGWDVLGMEFRVVLDFGCGAVDWRGAYLNPGA
ncbi:prohead protease/major capsid protein fusion protein [Frigidibacter sp. MR17.14]|uniref:prohead protease/major capsid protein fusion protein n=1 Tax=Frigidibacter sp. MR17.14 TaxID=3126509 RepID=UPI0030130E02